MKEVKFISDNVIAMVSTLPMQLKYLKASKTIK
jgi:hypothetical protein